MPTSRLVRKKVQVYANTLFEFASKAGTEAQALDALERLVACSPEVRSTVLTLCELGRQSLLPEVTKGCARILAGDDALEPGDATVVAKTLVAAARSESRTERVVPGLSSLGVMTDEVVQMLAVMGTGSDARLLPSVLAAYNAIVGEQGSTVPVEVTTALPLDDTLRASIERKMHAELKKPVYLVEHVDPSIIGGLVLKVGDQRRDASVRAQLESMRQILTNPSVGGDK